MNMTELKNILKKTFEIDCERLKENSEIVNQQLMEKDYGFGKVKLNKDGLIELLLMKGIYAFCIELKDRGDEGQEKKTAKKKRKRIPEPGEWVVRLWEEAIDREKNM